MIIKQNSKTSPVLLDKIVQDLQLLFTNNLSWLNYAFGKSYKLVKLINETEFIYPAVHLNQGEYTSVMPDDTLGNFCFFEFNDPQEFNNIQIGKTSISGTGFIVFWFKLSTIYSDYSVHYGEEVKQEILKLLNTPGILQNGSFKVLRVFEKPENIYRGYSLKQVESQYLMFPYAGIRIEYEYKINELC